MRKITPFLWFDKEAEEAAKFYVSIFDNSKIGAISHYGKGAPEPEGTVMVVPFQLEGEDFLALNGGPLFKFTEAISFVVSCDTQAEIDEKWEKLLAGGGKESQCGWLKDKYGLSWQIVPTMMAELMRRATPEQSSRMMQAVMQMVKIDIQKLKDAFDGV